MHSVKTKAGEQQQPLVSQSFHEMLEIYFNSPNTSAKPSYCKDASHLFYFDMRSCKTACIFGHRIQYLVDIFEV